MSRAKNQTREDVRTLFVTTAAVAALALPALVQAQQQGQAQQPAQQQQRQQQERQAEPSEKATVESADVSDQEIEQFAKSLNAVIKINDALQADLANTQDPDKTQQLRQKANAEMAAAIRSNGMEVERYNAISRSLKEDATLNQRVMAERSELQSPPADKPADSR